MKRAHEEGDGNAEPAAKKDRAEGEEESKAPTGNTSGTEKQQPPAQPAVPPPRIHEHDTNSEEEDNSDSNSMENKDEDEEDDDDESITYDFSDHYDWKYNDGVYGARDQEVMGEDVVFHSNAGICNGEEQVENAKMLLALMPTNAPKSVAQLLGGALQQEAVEGDGEEPWRPIWVLGSNLWSSSSSDTAATSSASASGCSPQQQPWTPGISDVQEMLKEAFGMQPSRIETRVRVTRLHAANDDDGLALSSGQEIVGMDDLRSVFQSHAFGNAWFYIHVDVDVLTPYFIGCFVGEGAEKSDVLGFAAVYSCFVST